MKKSLSLILLSILIIQFCACGSNRNIPDGMSQEVYELGMRAVQLIDDYHTGKISSADVNGPLESIISRLDDIEKEDKGKQTAKTSYGLQNSDYANYISFWISSFIDHKDSKILDSDTYDAYYNLCRLMGIDQAKQMGSLNQTYIEETS